MARKAARGTRAAPRLSAGLLLYRLGPGGPELFLAHMGGPYWVKKDDGGWTVPKGGVWPGEDELAAARREFEEETGLRPKGPFHRLPSFRLPSGRTAHIFAVEGDADPALIRSNSFTLEWPPRSGRLASFPEVDRAAWFDPQTARRKLANSQAPLVEAFLTFLAGHSPAPGGDDGARG
jgi:predicted NUDIX family NTP pyrophosphohydrolase